MASASDTPSDFDALMERTRLPERLAGNLVDAGALDGLQGQKRQPRLLQTDVDPRDLPDRDADTAPVDRRVAFQEVSLRAKGRGVRPRQSDGGPTTYQMNLVLPVAQDFLDVPRDTAEERMTGEYRTMGLFPAGHVMATLRTALLLLLLLLIFQPVLRSEFEGQRPQPVVLLLDNSQSMKQQDRRLSQPDLMRVAPA